MTPPFKVIAIISAFNEGDIISAVIKHLVENAVEVYLVDNRSTDDTVEQAKQWIGRGLIDIETFPPATGQDGKFEWAAILKRKEELTRELTADWFIHHDADEIRISPWPGVSLQDGIRWVDSLDYNCINFRVFNFPPVDNGYKQGQDLRTYFTHYEKAGDFDRVQLKCWKSGSSSIALVPSGGHEVSFPRRRVFPIPFLCCHYPIRSQAHGLKKVFSERRQRFVESERKKGWHRQYDRMSDKTTFLRNPKDLIPFNLNQAQLELQIPAPILADFAAISKRRADSTEAMPHSTARTFQEIVAIDAGELLEQLREHTRQLERTCDDLRWRIRDMERERAAIKQYVQTLETERDQLRRYSQIIEKDRARIRRLAEVSEATNNEHQAAVSILRHKLQHIENSLLWRSRSRFRRLIGRADHSRVEVESAPDAESIYSSVDTPPDPAADVSGICRVSGWACAPSGITSIIVFLDRHEKAQLVPHLERPDVAQVYPDIAGSGLSGFDTEIDLSFAGAEVHDLEVVIQDNAGNKRSHQRRLRVTS